tara:strand:+ start:32059 stop:32271 length:213 start_codon:yes stop_codon:yes gene_type:complete
MFTREYLRKELETLKSEGKEFGGEFYYKENIHSCNKNLISFWNKRELREEIPEMEYCTLDLNHGLGWEYS